MNNFHVMIIGAAIGPLLVTPWWLGMVHGLFCAAWSCIVWDGLAALLRWIKARR